MKGQRLIIRNNGITKIIINYQNLNDFSLRNGVILNPNQIRHIWCVKGTFTHTFGALEIISNIDWPPVKSVRKSPTPTPTPTPTITPTPTNTPTPTITPTNTPTPTQLPLSLNLTFDNIENTSSFVHDPNNISDWNTFFDLPTNGNPFTSVNIIGNEVSLFGGSEITLIDGLFTYYNHLTKVEDSGSVITIMGTFEECGALTEVSFNGCTQVLIGDANYGSFGYSTVVTANFPVCTYMESAFYDSNLVSIFAPLLATAGDGCFEYCDSLTTIDLPQLTTAGFGCFKYCDSLTTIDLPQLTTAGDYCFTYCTSLTTINLPSLTTASNYCFSNCTSLTTIDLPQLTTAGDGCFEYCDSLTTIDLPQLTTAGYYCFNNCDSLTTIDLPQLTTAGFGCFNDCDSLTTIDLPQLTTAGDYCFNNCDSLTTISLPSCTDLGGTVGDDSVFAYITGNTITLTIPSALMTCNSGNPDGDIQYLQANNTVTIFS
jgi:hypothetical protein